MVCPRQSVSPITGGCVAPAERWYVLGGRLVRGVSPSSVCCENRCEWFIRQDRCDCVKRSFGGVVCPRSQTSAWHLLGHERAKHTGGWRLRDCGVSPGELFRALSGPGRCMAPTGGCWGAWQSAARIVMNALSGRIVTIALNRRFGAGCAPVAIRSSPRCNSDAWHVCVTSGWHLCACGTFVRVAPLWWCVSALDVLRWGHFQWVPRAGVGIGRGWSRSGGSVLRVPGTVVSCFPLDFFR